MSIPPKVLANGLFRQGGAGVPDVAVASELLFAVGGSGQVAFAVGTSRHRPVPVNNRCSSPLALHAGAASPAHVCLSPFTTNEGKFALGHLFMTRPEDSGSMPGCHQPCCPRSSRPVPAVQNSHPTSHISTSCRLRPVRGRSRFCTCIHTL